MTNKKLLYLLIIILVLLGMNLSYMTITGYFVKEDGEVMKIGAILPLSGKNAEWGEKTLKGIDLALEETNNKNIKVIYEDSGGENFQAVSAAHKLIKMDKVDVLVCQLSNVCSAIAPLAQENKMVLLGFTHTPGLTESGDFIYNMRGESQNAGKRLAEFAIKRNKKAAVFYLNNPTQKGVYEGFRDYFENYDGEIVYVDYHNSDEFDFKTQLIKAKAKNPDVLVFCSRPKNVVELVKETRELGLNQPIISTLGFDTKSIIDSLGILSEGIVYPTAIVSYDIEIPKLKKALETYESKYNEQMPLWTAESYDLIKLLDEFSKKDITSSEEIRENLISTDFIGLSGNIKFDNKRVINKKYYIFIVKNGEFVPYID